MTSEQKFSSKYFRSEPFPTPLKELSVSEPPTCSLDLKDTAGLEKKTKLPQKDQPKSLSLPLESAETTQPKITKEQKLKAAFTQTLVATRTDVSPISFEDNYSSNAVPTLAAILKNNFADLLQQLADNESNTKPAILGLGCGIAPEVRALQLHFPKTFEKIKFVGIDIDSDTMHKLNRCYQTAGYTDINFFCADASNQSDVLQCLKDAGVTSVALICICHPHILDTWYGKSFKLMLNTIIPQLATSQTKLLITTYAEKERKAILAELNASSVFHAQISQPKDIVTKPDDKARPNSITYVIAVKEYQPKLSSAMIPETKKTEPARQTSHYTQCKVFGMFAVTASIALAGVLINNLYSTPGTNNQDPLPPTPPQ